MSKMRHPVHICPRLPAPVTALAFDFPHRHTIIEHMHPEDQLVYACQGVMTVRTSGGTWVVPAQRAVWIPARTPHSISMSGTVSMRTIYLRARLVRPLPRACCVVNVSPLLQQLIVHLCAVGKLNRRSKTQAHLIDVLIDQFETLQAVPLQLPTPTDARAARVAAALQSGLSDSCSLERACRQAGASKRTIERLFQQETRMSLGKWHQQLRLLKSLQLLAAGEKISHAALEAGYSTPSAFIAMFRKALGTTPRRYFENSSARP
ncbi:MAG TPA: helix-turn-helix transcriptional regulator [Candidatus Dormibacteraeota bacterium]|nr:helix-turn-helix transcriptional regulator [Candidatus Dormibacteraeota bacterium]